MFCFITTYCGDTLQLSIVQTHVMEPKYIHAHVYCTIPSLPPHIQLVLFAKSKFALTDFLQDNQRTFANLFINNIPGLDPDDSQTPSPIITLYTTDDLVGQLSYTADRVSSIAHFLSFSLVHTHTQRVFLSFFFGMKSVRMYCTYTHSISRSKSWLLVAMVTDGQMFRVKGTYRHFLISSWRWFALRTG